MFLRKEFAPAKRFTSRSFIGVVNKNCQTKNWVRHVYTPAIFNAASLGDTDATVSFDLGERRLFNLVVIGRTKQSDPLVPQDVTWIVNCSRFFAFLWKPCLCYTIRKNAFNCWITAD